MILLVCALCATMLALFAGLRNFWEAGSGTKTYFWMRMRLVCQGLALALFALCFAGG